MSKNTQPLNSHITVEDLGDNIFYYTFRYDALTREITDSIVNIAKNPAGNLAPDEPIKSIYDSRETTFTLNPYFRVKVSELMEATMSRKNILAVIIKRNLATQVMQIFLRTLPMNTNLKIQIFHTPEEAITWVRKQANLPAVSN
jgi:hypothetical protein